MLPGLGRLVRLLPDGAWKQFLGNSIQSVEWPDVKLNRVRAQLPGSNATVTLTPHLGEFDFEAHLYRRLNYEAEVFAWLETRNYGTVVEIGANVGLFSIYFAKRFANARVYAFEPSRQAFSRLLENAAANACPNLLPFNCAVFSESGFLNFHEPAGHLTNGSLEESFARLLSPNIVTTLTPALAASAMEPFFVHAPVLVKIDVEGAEPALLRSLAGLIERHRPDLLVEVLTVTEQALNELAFLRDGRYRLFNLRPEGLEEQSKFVAREYRDYVLLPT